MDWEREQWSQEAEAQLMPALIPDQDIIRSEVEAGISELYRIGDTRLVTRLESYEDGTSELVLIAIVGSQAEQITNTAKESCKRRGIPSIRFHSDRKGAARFVEKMGFKPVETVYRFEV